MKEITIYFSDKETISISDFDDELMEKYVEELSQILESNNVSIIHTSTCSVIIRPNTIKSIIVFNNIEDNKKEKDIKNNKVSVNKKTEDIITD